MACAILEKTSGLKPSCKTTAVWYLKRVTLPSFCSFTLISLWVSLALSFVAWASSSSSSSARASTPSANRRLVITAIYVSFCTLFKESVEEEDDRRHPCLYSNCLEPFSRVPINLNCTCSLVLEQLQAAN